MYYTGNQSVNQWGPVSSPGSWIARQPASCIPHAGAAMQCWKNDAQTSDFNGVGHDNPRKLDAMSFQTTWCTWCSKASITCAFKAPGHNAITIKTALISSATSMKTVIDCFKPIRVPFCSSSVFRHILFVNSVLDIRRPLCSARSFMPFFPHTFRGFHGPLWRPSATWRHCDAIAPLGRQTDTSRSSKTTIVLTMATMTMTITRAISESLINQWIPMTNHQITGPFYWSWG